MMTSYDDVAFGHVDKETKEQIMKTTQRYEIEAWLGNDHGLSEERVDKLTAFCTELQEQYPDDPDRVNEDLVTAYLALSYTEPQCVIVVEGQTTRVPLFDEGMPLDESAPRITDLVRTSALHLNRARHGADVRANQTYAQTYAKTAASIMQEYAGSRVSYSAALSIVWHMVDLTATALES